MNLDFILGPRSVESHPVVDSSTPPQVKSCSSPHSSPSPTMPSPSPSPTVTTMSTPYGVTTWSEPSDSSSAHVTTPTSTSSKPSLPLPIDHLATAACQAAQHMLDEQQHQHLQHQQHERSFSSTPCTTSMPKPTTHTYTQYRQLSASDTQAEAALCANLDQTVAHRESALDDKQVQPQHHFLPFSPVSSSHSNLTHESTQTAAIRQATRALAVTTNNNNRAINKNNSKCRTGLIATNELVTMSNTSRCHLCERCGKSFSLKVRFLHHLLMEHNVQVFDSRTILPCHKCPSAFLRNTDRSKHDLCVHERLRPFRCSTAECNSAFFFEKDLVKHQSTVHLRHKPFRCSICPKAFGKREHMTSHVKRVHHKLRPFRCEVCDIRLASKYNLQGHLKTAAHAAAESLRRRTEQQGATVVAAETRTG